MGEPNKVLINDNMDNGSWNLEVIYRQQFRGTLMQIWSVWFDFLYVPIHIKIIFCKFCSLNPNKSWVICS